MTKQLFIERSCHQKSFRFLKIYNQPTMFFWLKKKKSTYLNLRILICSMRGLWWSLYFKNILCRAYFMYLPYKNQLSLHMNREDAEYAGIWWSLTWLLWAPPGQSACSLILPPCSSFKCLMPHLSKATLQCNV